jgi:hypothetical protein
MDDPSLLEEEHVAETVGAYHEGPPVLDPRPLATFRGHSADVLDVSWSAGNFLLSASVSSFAGIQLKLSQSPKGHGLTKQSRKE